jgi:Zn-dependent protease with chaperone function
MIFINIILTIYTWSVVSILLLFLVSIARFYEKKSGKRSFYQLFLIPAVFFIIATIRYVFISPSIAGDFFGDMSRFIGGIILIGVSFYLLKLMIGGRS